MSEQEIPVDKKDIELAERISSDYPGHREQVFTAVLTSVLIGRSAKKDKDSVVSLGPRRLAKPIAATEFFAKLKPGQDVDKVLGAAYFLETYAKAQDFTPEEIKKCLLEGKIKPPANISLAVLRNAQKGLMAQAGKREGARKSWILTQTGTEAVEQLLLPASKDKE